MGNFVHAREMDVKKQNRLLIVTMIFKKNTYRDYKQYHTPDTEEGIIKNHEGKEEVNVRLFRSKQTNA